MVAKAAPESPVEAAVVAMLTTIAEVVDDAITNPGVRTVENAARIDWAVDKVVSEARLEGAAKPVEKAAPWGWAYRRKATTDHPATEWKLVFDDRDLHYPHLEVVTLYSGV